MPSDRHWISSLPPDLARQRRAIVALLEFCEKSPLVTSLSVGCSIGRDAADALSDVDAAIGVRAPRGSAGAEQVRSLESSTVELLSRLGTLVDVLRQETAGPDFFLRRVFAQFEDRLQLDLALVAEPEVRRGTPRPTSCPSTGRVRNHTRRTGPRRGRSMASRSTTGRFLAGGRCWTRTSICNAPRCGRPIIASMKPEK
jgi:hypothetical protein